MGSYESVEQPSEDSIVDMKGPGDSFGELALLHHAPRAANVRCCRHAVVWVISRDTFQTSLVNYQKNRTDNYTKFLEQVRLLSELRIDERQAIAQELIPESHN